MTSSDPASSETTIGILAPSAEDRELIRGELSALSWVRVGLEVDQYSVAPGDRSVRRFLEVQPEVIIVDMEDPRLAIQTLPCRLEMARWSQAPTRAGQPRTRPRAMVVAEAVAAEVGVAPRA